MKKEKLIVKIGIDFHGVIDTYPSLFSIWSNLWVKAGFEVHILTGREWDYIEPKLKTYKINFTHYFSIVDYHKSIGTLIEEKKDGVWMDTILWNKSKGDYCSKENISILFDNDLKYAEYMPHSTSFVWVREKGFENFFDSLLIKPK